jgi:predicted phosphodiesterase
MKIGIISDIHEDIIRLKQAIEILGNEGCEKIVCTGDFVGYSVPFYGFLKSRNAHEVITLLKEKCCVVVAGNHDLYAIRKLPEYTAGFNYPEDWYSLDYAERIKLANDQVYLYENNELSALLTKEDEEYIKNLPEFVVENFDGMNILFSHYSFPDLTGSTTLEPKTAEDVKSHFLFMKQHGCNIGISGHDHQEGIVIFSEADIRKVSFEKVVIGDNPAWINGPCIANGTFSNGVMIFDTKKLEITAIPLNTEKHVKPEWRNK